MEKVSVPALVSRTGGGGAASFRFLEFFSANIRNPHTRRAYSRAVVDFLAWCEDAGVRSIARCSRCMSRPGSSCRRTTHAAPTAKQRLAAVRHLFDWLVIGQVVPVNPAASVRGPAHIVKAGKTPVLEPAEARALLDSIDVATPAGLRDRALIGADGLFLRPDRRRARR